MAKQRSNGEVLLHLRGDYVSGSELHMLPVATSTVAVVYA